MRRIVVSLAVLLAFAAFGAGLESARSDNLGDLFNAIVKAADQASRDKAYRQWSALPQDVLNCVMQNQRIDVNGLIQRGIGPKHPQVKPYVQQCQAAVESARQQAAQQAEQQRQAAEAAERARQQAEEAERERQRQAEEAERERERQAHVAAEKKIEAEHQALAKFKTDVTSGRKGYGAITRTAGTAVCLEEGSDADAIVFGLKGGRIAGAISYLANGQIIRAEAGVAVARFERGDCALLIASAHGLAGALALLERSDVGAKPADFWIAPEQIATWHTDFATAQAAEAERLRKEREEAMVLEQRRRVCLVDTGKQGYFAQVCMAAAYEMRGRNDLAAPANDAAATLRAKLTLCTDDDLVDVRAKARVEAERILSSGAVGPFADLKSGIELECKKSAALNK